MCVTMALGRICEKAVRTLLARPARTLSLRLLADESAKVLAGIVQALDGLALLVDASEQPPHSHRGFRLSVPDWLPALVNAARAFVTIGAVELLWVVTAWPNGASAIVFVAIVMLLLSPRGDLAYLGAIAFQLASGGSIFLAANRQLPVL